MAIEQRDCAEGQNEPQAFQNSRMLHSISLHFLASLYGCPAANQIDAREWLPGQIICSSSFWLKMRCLSLRLRTSDADSREADSITSKMELNLWARWHRRNAIPHRL